MLSKALLGDSRSSVEVIVDKQARRPKGGGSRTPVRKDIHDGVLAEPLFLNEFQAFIGERYEDCTMQNGILDGDAARRGARIT